MPAIVLAGGRASRLGRDKASLLLAGRTLLERTRAAARDAGLGPVLVIGPQTGGGPVAAIAAALRRLDGDDGDDGPDRVVVLPTDLAHPDAALARLLDADRLGGGAAGHVEPARATAADRSDRAGGTGRGPAAEDGAVLVDDDGREQWLTAIYRTAALRRALAALGDPSGAPVRALVGGLRLVRVPAGTDATDIDTWEDYERVRHQAP